ncbi:small ribosomal subunit protein mS29 [Prorops nasuta]|uniref:small ribosomal subunit protein mS29 n=1 Tax=Prorops nasuta TaxID=863751 RepID=UPI0034CFAE15
MALPAQFILTVLCRRHARSFVTAAQPKIDHVEPLQSFRTNETNPSNHTEKYLSRFYTVPSEIVNHTFKFDGIPKSFLKQIKTFKECSIMIRKPAVEIISYLNQTDYSKSVNKYILYGKTGAGKSLTLIHIIHYAVENKFILVHVPSPSQWFKFPKEVANSTFMEGYIDLPVDAGVWLMQFKHKNLELLKALDLRISKDYVWNQRERNDKDSTLLGLIEFGITRIKYACNVINILMQELKINCIAGKCKAMVVIDGYNAFMSNVTMVKDENKKMVSPRKITLTTAFLDITNYDWCNGSIVLTVDCYANKERRDSNLPRYLLGKEGFEFVDPYLPVAVEDFTNDEFEAMMDYYKDRKWVREISVEGQQELQMLSNGNPYTLMDLCKSL